MQNYREKPALRLFSTLITLLCALTVPASAETQFSKDAIAKAEAALSKVKAACAPDVKSFCSTVTPGEGHCCPV